MSFRLVFFSLIGLSLLLTFFAVRSGRAYEGAVKALAQGQGPVVLELFTSQSCSSCPPAEALLNTLAKSSSRIIALSCHVTYWNHLSWQDTLSSPICTQRQYDYADFLGSQSRVYTPQMVINGRLAVVGSNHRLVAQAIAEQQDAVASVNIVQEGSGYRFKSSLITDAHTVWVIGYGRSLVQQVDSGENAGRSLISTHPVLSVRQVEKGAAAGESVFMGAHDFLSESQGFAVLVTPKGAVGPILAAGVHPLTF